MFKTGKENFLKLLKVRVQKFKEELHSIKASAAIPGDLGLKNLVEQFAEEFSTKSPGFFPGQIGPKKLVDYHNRFSEFVPGYASSRGGIGGAYAREVVMHLRTLFKAIYADLQNPNVEFPWLLDKLGSLFVRHGTVSGELTRFVGEKIANFDAILS